MADRCVFSVSSKGVEFCAPTFQALLDGAKLAPRPEPTVTPGDVRHAAKAKR